MDEQINADQPFKSDGGLRHLARAPNELNELTSSTGQPLDAENLGAGAASLLKREAEERSIGSTWLELQITKANHVLSKKASSTTRRSNERSTR